MAINKLFIDEVGQQVNYHRIAEVTFNFDAMQCHLHLNCYAAEAYRDKEKEQITVVQQQIARYMELDAKETLTDEEHLELLRINIQELMLVKVVPTVLKTMNITVDITNDIRGELYGILATLPLFSDSSMS